MKNKSVSIATLALGSTFALAGCGAEFVNPYSSDTPTEEITVAHGQSIAHTDLVLSGNFGETLNDGAHIVQFKNYTRPILIIKDDAPSHFRGHNYFGMTSIAEEFVPDRAPDMDNEKISTWTVHVEDLVEDNMHTDGIYLVTIDGHALNGQDLTVKVFKDSRVDGLKEYGYLGVDALPTPEPE